MATDLGERTISDQAKVGGAPGRLPRLGIEGPIRLMDVDFL
jgi:hypothetical protein